MRLRGIRARLAVFTTIGVCMLLSGGCSATPQTMSAFVQDFARQWLAAFLL